MKFKRYIKESLQKERCEKCDTLLNDGGTCPKCDDGEEDYGDDDLKEEMSVRDKLKAAYPELNFDTPSEDIMVEELSNKEKLLRAFPELDFSGSKTEASQVTFVEQKTDENCSEESCEENLEESTFLNSMSRQLNEIAEMIDDRLIARGVECEVITETSTSKIIIILDGMYGNESKIESIVLRVLSDNDLEAREIYFEEDPHSLVIDKIMERRTHQVSLSEDCNYTEDFEDSTYSEYDDDYDMDDVEMDRAHAALYGGDRMYCDCGHKLAMDDFGSYCPVCDAEEVELNKQYHSYSEDELKDLEVFDNLND